jgi:hypothetical protein
LSLEWFRSRAEKKVVIENWRRHYNALRPRSSLQYLTRTRSSASITRHPAEPSYKNEWLE